MTEEPGTTSEPPEGGETPDDQGGLSRRKFIGSVAAAGIGGLTLAGVLAACGGSSTGDHRRDHGRRGHHRGSDDIGRRADDGEQQQAVPDRLPLPDQRHGRGGRGADEGWLRPRDPADQRPRRGRRPDDRAGDRRHRHLHAGGRDHGVEQARGDGARRDLHRVPHRLAARVSTSSRRTAARTSTHRRPRRRSRPRGRIPRSTR